MNDRRVPATTIWSEICSIFARSVRAAGHGTGRTDSDAEHRPHHHTRRWFADRRIAANHGSVVSKSKDRQRHGQVATAHAFRTASRCAHANRCDSRRRRTIRQTSNAGRCKRICSHFPKGIVSHGKTGFVEISSLSGGRVERQRGEGCRVKGKPNQNVPSLTFHPPCKGGCKYGANTVPCILYD